jgi:hypothetical protein
MLAWLFRRSWRGTDRLEWRAPAQGNERMPISTGMASRMRRNKYCPMILTPVPVTG